VGKLQQAKQALKEAEQLEASSTATTEEAALQELRKDVDAKEQAVWQLEVGLKKIQIFCKKLFVLGLQGLSKKDISSASRIDIISGWAVQV
jgi:hypothetical protein